MANPALGNVVLCKAVVAAGLADRFTTLQLKAQLGPEANWYAIANAVERLWTTDLAERVIVSAGVWHYRLTAEGRRIGEGGKRRKTAGQLIANRRTQQRRGPRQKGRDRDGE